MSDIYCLKHDRKFPKGMICPACLEEEDLVTIEHRKSEVIKAMEAKHQHDVLEAQCGRGPLAVKTEAQIRKEHPMYSGVVKYFPRALDYVAGVSFVGNEQHNPGQPLHWAREKSSDHLDCLVRHVKDHAMGNPVDTDNVLHLGKAAWRALAQLELYLESLEKSK